MKTVQNLILLFLIMGTFSCEKGPNVPSYLDTYKEAFNADPRQANLQWFQEAKYGMFIHYGLYSQLERGEWVQLRDTIP
ncbi:MAG: alpha-L-fucosidase, partial [Bacteroidota bacterium]|nr:alpha-L-fucosidase [Bacteroidota bacterium]